LFQSVSNLFFGDLFMMFQRSLSRIFLALLLPLLALPACSPPGKSSDPGDSSFVGIPEVVNLSDEMLDGSGESLVNQWMAIANQPPEAMDMYKAVAIVDKLAEEGGEALDSIFAVLEDADQPAAAKMLAVASLHMHMKEEYQSRLQALTSADHDAATRGCAAHLLSALENESITQILQELAEDEDVHVRKVALLALMRQGNLAASNQAAALWFLPEATDADRTEIIYGFPEAYAGAHLNLFTDALARKTLEPNVHIYALEMLKQYGGPEACESVQKFIDTTEYAVMESMARETLAVLQSKADEAKAEGS
jgi:hypothetical protein